MTVKAPRDWREAIGRMGAPEGPIICTGDRPRTGPPNPLLIIGAHSCNSKGSNIAAISLSVRVSLPLFSAQVGHSPLHNGRLTEGRMGFAALECTSNAPRLVFPPLWRYGGSAPTHLEPAAVSHSPMDDRMDISGHCVSLRVGGLSHPVFCVGCRKPKYSPLSALS